MGVSPPNGNHKEPLCPIYLSIANWEGLCKINLQLLNEYLQISKNVQIWNIQSAKYFMRNIWNFYFGAKREALSNLASPTLIAFEFLLNKSTWNQYIFNAKFCRKFAQNCAHHSCCSVSLVEGFQNTKREFVS